MMAQLSEIVTFMIAAFGQVWPYLLLTIPLAVAVQMSGASRFISRAFQASPLVAIVLATAVGAFSPFCSCGVIPLIAALLIGGVPLAPVMSFWIASPSMDPEIFFLSAGLLGWQLATWRLLGTLALSLGAGLVTHLLVSRGWLGREVLRARSAPEVKSSWMLLKEGGQALWQWLPAAPRLFDRFVEQPAEALCCVAGAGTTTLPLAAAAGQSRPLAAAPAVATLMLPVNHNGGATCDLTRPGGGGACQRRAPFHRRLLRETWAATAMVVKFMALAFFLEALITLFVPQAWIATVLGRENPVAIVMAALVGVPIYTSNLTALPLVGGLLAQGMDPAAALAFLLAGPTTTLPAMAAVWGLVSRRVFALYVAIALTGAVVVATLFALTV